jgi:signal transduction histidine kinase
MSPKKQIKEASPAPEPALAKMLFTAIDEHDAALSRVSRLLHDDVSQTLSAVGLQLDALQMDFREQAPGLEGRATEIQTMLEQVIGQLRDISNEFNPSIVERAGLEFALDQLAGKIRNKFPVAVRMHFDPAARIPTPIAKAFYKIAECAMDMAGGRPECTLIEMRVKRTPDQFILEVHDNGSVEGTDSSPQTFDHMLLDYHASQNHVTLEIRGSQKDGTHVRALHAAHSPDGRT